MPAVTEAAILGSVTIAGPATFASGLVAVQFPNIAPNSLQSAVASAALGNDTATNGEQRLSSEVVQALAAFPCSGKVSPDDLPDVRRTGEKRLALATDDAAVGVATATPVARFVENAAAVERARAVDACLSDPACGDLIEGEMVDGAEADAALATSAEESEHYVPLIHGALFLGGMMAVLGRTPACRSRAMPGDLREATRLPTTSKAFSMNRTLAIPRHAQ